ncbi:MAG TPA: VOC family protein [Gemmatimonadaceae bacterium]
MRWLTLVLLLLPVWPRVLLAQTARVEPDHVFVFVSTGGEAEAEALRALGFRMDSGVMQHAGGGTASRSAVFENFYVELIWVDSTVGVSERSRERFAEMQRAAAWRSTGVSPFGLGLRKVEGPDEFGVPTTSYTEDWMLAGTSITVLKQASEPQAFDIFVVPSYMALPAWIEQVAELGLHANGARRVSALEIRGPQVHQPEAIRALSISSVRVTEASEPLLVLELDDRRAGETHDLRPLIPVVIRR